MISQAEAIRRLEAITHELVELKEAIEMWGERPAINQTQAFLEKCRGWEDSRQPEDIIADIYAARTSSDS
ncbi:MAG: hypothetical protein HY259_14220 [Chloroflexi bacterium]|nr:hypothetical protein [Chloroflexota bacterium]